MAKLGWKEALIVLTGGKNTGKSLAASTYLPPSEVGKIFYHDGESSANRIREQLKRRGLELGHYVNLDDRWRSLGLPGNNDLLSRIRRGKLPWIDTKQQDAMIAYWKYILEDLDVKLKQDKFKVYIHDPVERLEIAMQAYVDANKKETGWRRMGYGEKWTKAYYPLYRGLLSGIYERGVDAVIFTAHLGNPWSKEGPIIGKIKPRAKPELYILAQLYVWLTNEPGNGDGAPAGVIIKERLGVMEIKDNRWVLERRLPRRLPHFTWDDVEHYLQHGCDLANPAPGEVMTPEEDELISESYSDKLMSLMLYRAKTAYVEAVGQTGAGELAATEDPEMITIDLREQAILMHSAGRTVAEIATEMSKPAALIEAWVGE